MTDSHIDAVASLGQQLTAAYSGAPIDPIADEVGSIDRAYRVQLWQIEQRLAAGRRVVGRKIGLTSPAVQTQLGVGEPDFGHLTDEMVFGDNIVLDHADLRQPRIEAEVALILGRDLDLPGASVADVIAATDYVLPSLEVVASRIADWKIGILDTVADNASAGAVVLGGPARRIDGLDLSGCGMVMTINGEVASRGEGSDCLGSPLNAAAWLARTSFTLGRPLRAGEVILTGALGPMRPVAPGDQVHAVIDGLGTVSASFR
ncbi:fumarylacetoacetate hydrolase family protein [Sphingomonas sp. HF-S4]|uniref:Fumarylacetoacetate hydrolase family protein n=1 Tax=Sphingomonas agrestis TaxID=3080540 RepID=A0ABU3Y1W1_9SPHN|nr:fumarylacetoacetate hydrolase family protein [Sphingomonas sp. HF-S4]MDV3455370.1 fumarylacetoacetate hydrolase family protein [Sphingomonas sp. HF-S4]